MDRLLIGLSVSSGLEGVDAVAVRVAGLGLDLIPRVASAVRVAFPPPVRDVCRLARGGDHASRHPGLTFHRNIAETAVHATRQVLNRVGGTPRDAFAIGLLEPAHSPRQLEITWPELADRVAEETGLTILHGFRHRDRAAGGTGDPITAAADYLLLRSPTQTRLLVHLGAVSTLVFIPGGGKVSSVIGFEAGPGNQFLDALNSHGSRANETCDAGGKKAVQGKCSDSLLRQWLDHPHLGRKPPKTLHPDGFGRSFQMAAFDAARQLGLNLSDLLCTATHFIARAIGDAARKWLPTLPTLRQVLITGGGVRNGFLWQLISQQFSGEVMARADEAGLPALARNAAGASVLAALTCDGVAGNLAVLTGASGARLLGHIAPGDARNWSRVAAWLADQSGEYPGLPRAA